MDENKIILPDFLIADLYKNSLVDLYSFETRAADPVKSQILATEPKTDANAATISFLGENRSHVTVLVNEPNEVFVAEDNLSFLTNILKACDLTLADIAVVNTAKQLTTFAIIKQQLLPGNLLLFGVDPLAIKLPFQIPAFQIQNFEDCKIMLAPALVNLNKTSGESKLLKTKLWMSLKQTFNIG